MGPWGSASVTFGPFDFKIFDTADVVVELKHAGDAEWTATSAVTVTKSSAAALDTFSVTFDVIHPVTSTFRVRGARLHERSVGLAKGIGLDLLELEKEVSKHGIVLQETRADAGLRDADRARTLRAPDGESLPAIPPVADRATRILGFDVDGHPVAMVPGTADAQAVANTYPRRSADNKSWEAYTSTQVLKDLGAFFGTRAQAVAAKIPDEQDWLRTFGYAEPCDGGGALYKRAASEPAHERKFPSADGAWWELVPENDGINLLQLGCPLVSAVTAEPIYDATTAIVAAMAFNGILNVPRGQFQVNPFENTNSTKIRGAGSEHTTFLIQPTSNAPSVWGLSSDMEFCGYTVKIDPAVIGEHDGLYSTGLTIGRYFYAPAYDPIRRVKVDDVKVVRTGAVENLVNSFTIIGDVAGVTATNCEAVGGLGGMVMHWGVDQIGTYGDAITTRTFHPNDITVENFKVSDTVQGWAVFISACYNVTVNGLTVDNVELAVSLQAGDVGNTYSVAAEKDLVNTGIHVDGVHGTVVNPTTAQTSAITVRGSGNYNGDWNVTPFKNCSIRNVTLFADGVTAASSAVVWARELYATNHAANSEQGIVFENIRVWVDPAETEQTKGFHFELGAGIRGVNLQTNAHNGVNLDRVKNSRFEVFAKNPNATTTATENYGVRTAGARYTEQLNANVAAGATSLSVAASFDLRLFPGDILRLSSDPSKHAVVSAFTNGTTIPVEATDFTATSGDFIYLDKRIENVDVSGGVKGYPYGVSGRIGTNNHINGLNLEGIVFEECGLHDISLQNADFVNFTRNTHKEGGTRQRDVASNTRCLDLEKVANSRISRNVFGADSRYYNHAIYYRDANCYNLVVDDNLYGAFIGDEIAGTALAGAYSSPDRTNTYARQRLVAGGDVTPVLT